MLQFRKRNTLVALVAALVIGVSYRYWLTAPVLGNWSVGKWRTVGFVFAVVIGFLLVRIGLNNLLALVCSSMVGLVLGGIWTAMEAPNDVTTSLSTKLSEAFIDSLRLWPEIALFTVAVALGGLVIRLVNRR